AWRPAIEPLLTMCPPSRMCGRQRRVIRIRPLTFVSSCVSSSASVDSQNGSRPRPRPALLTRMSSPPSSPIAASTNCSQLSRSVTSSSSLISVSSCSTRRAPPATRTPSPARADAVAAPMPLEAPVTIAVFPSRPATTGRTLTSRGQQGLATPEVRLRPLRLEERLRLRELGVGLRAPSGGCGVLGRVKSRHSLCSPGPRPLVNRGGGREIPAGKGDPGLEPRRRGCVFRQLEIVGLAAEVAQDPRQVAEPPLVELRTQGEELVDEIFRLAALPVEKERPRPVDECTVKLLRVPDLTGELETAP